MLECLPFRPQFIVFLRGEVARFCFCLVGVHFLLYGRTFRFLFDVGEGVLFLVVQGWGGSGGSPSAFSPKRYV